MPASSRKQQRYLANKFGPGWLREHHFDKLAPKKNDAVADALRHRANHRRRGGR